MGSIAGNLDKTSDGGFISGDFYPILDEIDVIYRQHPCIIYPAIISTHTSKSSGEYILYCISHLSVQVTRLESNIAARSLKSNLWHTYRHPNS